MSQDAQDCSDLEGPTCLDSPAQEPSSEVGAIFTTSLCCTLEHQHLLEGSFTYYRCPYFQVRCPGFSSCYPADATWSPGSGGQRVCIPGIHKTLAIREMVRAKMHPTALHREQMEPQYL